MFNTMVLSLDADFSTASAAAYPARFDISSSISASGYGYNYAAIMATKRASERFLEHIVTEGRCSACSVFIHRPNLISRSGTTSLGFYLVRIMCHYAQLLHVVPVFRTEGASGFPRGRLDLVALDVVVQEVMQDALGETLETIVKSIR